MSAAAVTALLNRAGVGTVGGAQRGRMLPVKTACTKSTWASAVYL